MKSKVTPIGSNLNNTGTRCQARETGTRRKCIVALERTLARLVQKYPIIFLTQCAETDDTNKLFDKTFQIVEKVNNGQLSSSFVAREADQAIKIERY